MQGIQLGAVIDGILTERAELEIDAFPGTACRKTAVRRVYGGGSIERWLATTCRTA
jgi:hypothetical protein